MVEIETPLSQFTITIPANFYNLLATHLNETKESHSNYVDQMDIIRRVIL